MTGPIEIDPEMMRKVAKTLVDTYEELRETPRVRVERGDTTETTKAFRTKMKDALEAHTQNRETLILKLGVLSQQVRELGGAFEELEDEYTHQLNQLENHAYSIQEHRRADAEAQAPRTLPSGNSTAELVDRALAAIAATQAAQAQQGGSGPGSGTPTMDGGGL